MEGNVKVVFSPPVESASAVTDAGAPQRMVGTPLTVWARVRDVAAGESIRSDTQVGEVSTEFSIRRTSRTARIGTRWTAVSRGARYNITQVRRAARPGTVRDEWLIVVGSRLT